MTQKRAFPTQATDPALTGKAYSDRVNEYGGWALNNTPASLTINAGSSTADAIVATSETAITSYAAAQRHIIYPLADNTGPVTIAIDGLPVRAVVDAAGLALTGGELQTGMLTELLDNGTHLRIVNQQVNSGAGSIDVQEFTASGTWSKPAGVFQWAEVLIIGGGGSGARDDAPGGGPSVILGGCGGTAAIVRIPFSALTSSEAVSIGAGGGTTSNFTGGQNGGSSSFGTFVTTPGGAGGTFSPPYPQNNTAPSLAANAYPISVDNGQPPHGATGSNTTTVIPIQNSLIAGPSGASTSSANLINYSEPARNGLGAIGGAPTVDASGYGAGGCGRTSVATASTQQGTSGFCRVICY